MIKKAILIGLSVFQFLAFSQDPKDGGYLFSQSFIPIEDYKNEEGQIALFSTSIPLLKKKIDDPEVIISIVDSGILKGHPQLEPFIVGMHDFTNTSIDDRIGHGTSVAMTNIQESYDNVELVSDLISSETTTGILVAKVINEQSDEILLDNVISAIKWSAEQGALIINLSLGFVGDYPTYKNLCKTIKKYPNIYFVVAAGNYREVDVYPACCKNAKNVLVIGDNSASSGKCAQFHVDMTQVQVPVSGETHFYELGNNEARNGNLKKALNHYSSSLEILPKAETYFQIALIHFQQKKYSLVKSNLDSALKLRKEFPEAIFHMGAFYDLTGNSEKAELYYLKSIKSSENLEIEELIEQFTISLINFYYRNKNYCKALDKSEELLKIRPEDNELIAFVTLLKNNCDK